MVIDPEAGIVYETPDIPLGDFINKIFLFSFETLSYETH
jgi:hypothetical protein